MQAFSTFADELGLKNARVGMEVPSWYLNPHQYVRVKEILGDGSGRRADRTSCTA